MEGFVYRGDYMPLLALGQRGVGERARSDLVLNPKIPAPSLGVNATVRGEGHRVIGLA